MTALDSFNQTINVGDWVFKFSQKRGNIGMYVVEDIHEVRMNGYARNNMRLRLMDGSRETSQIVKTSSERVLLASPELCKSVLIKRELMK